MPLRYKLECLSLKLFKTEYAIIIGWGGKGGGVNSLIVAYYKVYKQQLEIANVSRTIFRQLTAMLCRYKEEMIMGFDNKTSITCPSHFEFVTIFISKKFITH